MKFSLKTAKPGDAKLLAEMMAQFYKEDKMPLNKAKAKLAFSQILRNKTLGYVWLIFTGKLAVGYVVVTHGFSMEFYGRDAFVDDFYIKREFRRQGAGKMILKAVIQKAKRSKIKALHLEASRKKPRVRRFYQKFGFQKRSYNYLMSKVL